MTDAAAQRASQLHKRAMALAEQGDAAKRDGNLAEAARLYQGAYNAECLATSAIVGRTDLKTSLCVMLDSAWELKRAWIDAEVEAGAAQAVER